MGDKLSNKIIKLSTKRPVVFVTGCGSGIGYAIAKLLYTQNQFRVVVTAKSEESIVQLKMELPENERFIIRQLDITKEESREILIAKIFSEWKSIDILINNAGISYRSVIEHMDEESELKQLDINYLSPLALIRLVIPSMRERGGGKIINVSSVSGMVAMPTMASYSVSKHALEGASEALWYELRPFGISVSLVQPGFIKSNSFEKIYYSKKATLSLQLEGPYAEYYTNMGNFVAKLMNKSFITPENVAKKILKLMNQKHPTFWQPVTPDASTFYWLRKLLPRHLFHKVMYRLLPKISDWGVKHKKKKRVDYDFITAR